MWLLGLTLLPACSDSIGPGATLTAVAGSNQFGKVGVALSQPLVVQVSNAEGAAVGGATVSWTVVTGGGSVPGTSTTGSNGQATAAYQPGSLVGVHTIRATLPQAPDVSATFTVTVGPAADLQLVAEIPVSPLIHDTFVRDGLAFVCAWSTGGIRIYDVGNGIQGGSPADPKLVSQLTMPSPSTGSVQVHNAWWFWNPVSGEKRYLFVGEESAGVLGQSSSGDIHVVDVSNLAAPRKVASYHMNAGFNGQSAGVHNFWMDEPAQVLYAGYYNGGVVALDVSGSLAGDLAAREIARVNPAGGTAATYVWGVQLHNGTVYVSDFLNGLSQVRLAAGSFQRLTPSPNVTERYTSDLWIHGGYGYTGTWGGAARGGRLGNALKIWELGAAGLPTLRDSIIIGDVITVSDVEVTADGKALVLSTERETAGGVYIYSLANPAKPVYLARALAPRGMHTAAVADINGRRYVFAAKNSEGTAGSSALRIYDMTGVVP